MVSLAGEAGGTASEWPRILILGPNIGDSWGCRQAQDVVGLLGSYNVCARDQPPSWGVAPIDIFHVSPNSESLLDRESISLFLVTGP